MNASRTVSQIARRFWRDEEGQAMPFFAVYSLVLAMCLIINYNVGTTVSEKIRAQNVADAAAYTASVWQARFLNYCAYTRRAIMANWCNIAAMNVMISNQEMFKRIAEERWFANDTDDGKDKFEDEGITASPIAELIKTAMNGCTTILLLDNTGDHRKVAEHMNKIMSNSQEVLFECVVNPEEIMIDVLQRSGSPNTPNEFELVRLNPIPFLKSFPNLNIELNDLVERRVIPINEVRWQFDYYTLPLIYGKHGSGFGPVPGRYWNMFYHPFNCNDTPFYMITEIKKINSTKQGTPFIGQIFGSPFKSKTGILRPWADITDQESEHKDDGMSRSVGQYIVSHEGKGKHFSHEEDKDKVKGAYCFWVKKLDKEYCAIPETFKEIYSGGSTQAYELMYRMDEFEVREVKRDLDDDELEPSVYCVVRRPANQIGYLRIIGLENPHDIFAAARAKVNYVTPDENLQSFRVHYPNLNYPFWTAKLAPFDDGRTASTIKFTQFLIRRIFIGPFFIPRGLDY